MILIALGANLPGRDGASPLRTCQQAAQRLDGLLGLRLVATSSWHRTRPVPPMPGAPDYINGVVMLAGQADPAALLAALQAEELAAGRQRPFPNAPRCLDLDLIDLNGLLRDGPDPVLPHPRAHLRRFVLAPLAEVAPDWIHPRLGQPVAALLAGLPAED